MPIHQNSKVVIFDDKYEEVSLLVETFQRQLIPSIYIKFNDIEGTLDTGFKKLKNVRLIFSDFVVDTLSGSDPKAILSPIINAFDATIDKSNGPFIVVIWSAHSKFKSDFNDMLKSVGYSFLILELDKVALNASKDIKEVQKKLKSALGHYPYFMKFLGWETAIKDASSSILQLFLEQMDHDNIKKHYTQLGQAAVGKSVHKHLNSPEQDKAFYTTMTSLINDEMEKSVNIESTPPIKIEEADSEGIDQVKLNTKILVDQNISRCNENFPGNVYLYDQMISVCHAKHDKIEEHCSINIDELIEEVFQRNFLDTNKIKIDNKEIYAVFVEISPFCDHAQKNIKKAKLLPGLLVKNTMVGSFQSMTPSLYISQPLSFSKLNPDNNFRFCLSFKHLMCMDPTISKDFKPLFRLRKEFVNEIQHQQSFYYSRPGLTTLY